MNEQIETTRGSASDPPALSEEYHHARRNLNLASALFLASELLGLRLPADKSGRSQGDIFGFEIELLSAGALAWVLLTIVLFFGLRLILEWMQCSPRRRTVNAARADLGLSLFIGLFGITVFSIQRLRNIQLLDWGNDVRVAEGFILSATGWAALVLWYALRSSRTQVGLFKNRSVIFGFAAGTSLIFFVTLLYLLSTRSVPELLSNAAFTSGLLVGTATVLFLSGMNRFFSYQVRKMEEVISRLDDTLAKSNLRDMFDQVDANVTDIKAVLRTLQTAESDTDLQSTSETNPHSKS